MGQGVGGGWGRYGETYTGVELQKEIHRGAEKSRRAETKTDRMMDRQGQGEEK